jgi:hypothetical protein
VLAPVFDRNQVDQGVRKHFESEWLVKSQGDFLIALGGKVKMHQWLKANEPFPYFQDRYELYADIQSRNLSSEAIDYLEFGVRYGDSLFRWSSLNTCSDSRFIGFDSFEGIPEDWVSVTGTAKKGAFSVEGCIPKTDDRRVKFVKGWFNETLRSFLKNFPPRSRLVIQNDGDLFSSTLYTLATVDPILRPGTILIFDEFANPLHEWRAFEDYASAFGRKFKVLGTAGEYYTNLAMEIV